MHLNDTHDAFHIQHMNAHSPAVMTPLQLCLMLLARTIAFRATMYHVRKNETIAQLY